MLNVRCVGDNYMK